MKPFVSQYLDLYGTRAARGMASDAFSVISTNIGSSGVLFSLGAEKALAVLFSKTPHDARMFAGQIYSAFSKITLNTDTYKPDLESFANFDVDAAETKQELRDFLDKIQE